VAGSPGLVLKEASQAGPRLLRHRAPRFREPTKTVVGCESQSHKHVNPLARPSPGTLADRYVKCSPNELMTPPPEKLNE
jgi:hypothetical protein